MAILFHDDYLTCVCGNKHFSVEKIYAFETKKKQLEPSHFAFTCTNCKVSQRKGLDEIKEDTL